MTFWLALLLCARAAQAAPSQEESSKAAQMHFLKGSLMERSGAVAEALSEYEQAFEADPQSAYICRQAAELGFESGNIEAGAKWVKRLEKLEPQAAQTKLLAGRAAWAAGDLEAARGAFEAALKVDPKSAETIFSLGSLLSQKEPAKARSLYEKFLETNPENAGEVHYQIALLDQREGKLSQAVERLKKAIELDPDAPPIRYTLAQIYEVQKDTDAALGQYLQILTMEPENVALLDHLGEIYFVKGQQALARDRFSQAQALSPGDAPACQWLAILAEHEGNFAEAAQRLKGSSALNEDASVSLRLSYYYSQAGQLKDAVTVLEKAHERWPKNDEAAYFLALGYDDLKLGEKAISLMRKVLELKPDYRDAQYQLAVLLEKYGRMEEAEKEFRVLIAKKPDDAGVLNYLGYSLADKGLKLDYAQELIERAVKVDPQNGAYQDSLGWVYFKQGRSTEAVHQIESALQRLPDDPTVWDHVGDAYAGMKESAKAWLAWRKAQALGVGEAAGKKASNIERELKPEDLGGLFLQHLSGAQGGLKKYSGLCEISGSILGHSFSFQGVMTFRGPDELDLDLLGPLFTPLLRLRLKRDGFTMDPIHIEGLDNEALTEAAVAAFSTIKDYLSGAFFAGKAAVYKSGWTSSSIEIPGWRLILSSDHSRLDAVEANGASPPPPGAQGVPSKLAFSEFSVVKARQVPMVLTVTGRGYTLSVKMRKANVGFK